MSEPANMDTERRSLTGYAVEQVTRLSFGLAVRAERDGRRFVFFCNLDGSQPRNIRMRDDGPSGKRRVGHPFRRLSATNAAKRAPDLERTVRGHLDGSQ